MDWFSLGFLGLCWNFPRLFSATTGEKNAEQWCHRISVKHGEKDRQTHRCVRQFMNWVAANLFFQIFVNTFSPFWKEYADPEMDMFLVNC